MDKQTSVSTQASAGRTVSLAAVGEGAAWSLAAFLLGQARLPFGCYPLGFALLCAARSRVVWILAGLIGSAFAVTDGSPWARVIAALLGALIRIAARIVLDPPLRDEASPVAARFRGLLTPGGRTMLWGESLTLRMATACATAFFAGLWRVVEGNFRYYDLFAAMLGMVAAPLFCLAVSPFFSPEARAARDLRFEGAAGLLLVSLCYAVRQAEVFGISVPAFLAFVLALVVTRRYGIARGALLGAGCGLCVGPLYAPLFALAAMASGLLWCKSATAAVTLAALGGMIWGGYVEGLMALIRLVPALVCGSIFVLSAERLGFLPGDGGEIPPIRLPRRQAQAEASVPQDIQAAVAAERAESAEARIAALSETFSALSQICYNLSDRLRRPGVIELRQLCDSTCDRYCRSCRSRDLCWEKEYGSTADVFGQLTIALHGAGKVGEDAIPDYFRARCTRLAEILDDINRDCARLWADGVRESGVEVFAVDYEAVSTILAETLSAEQEDYAIDGDLTARVRACASKLGLGAQGILAYGGRRKQIIAEGLDLRRAGLGVEELRSAFAEACGFALTAPVFEVREDLVSMRLSTARRYRVEAYSCSASAAAGEACGDSMLTLESGRRDCYYALISDGMGSGREAALTARLCTVFLEKMLASGNRRETALRLLNAFVRAKGLECSATIDLMELDLITGRASFIKSGAAPTYVRRDGNLFKLQSKTVPIGIMRALDAEQLCFDVEPGDILIMLSDGIAQSFEESVWLLDLLSYGWDEGASPEEIAGKILAGAEANNVRPDDRSVVLLRVEDAEAQGR